jgi:hypothetical protein
MNIFDINFSLANVFNLHSEFRNIWWWAKSISKNKSVEIEVLHDPKYLIIFNISHSIRMSHAGFRLELGLLGYIVEFQIYDARHWDYEKDDWEDEYSETHA